MFDDEKHCIPAHAQNVDVMAEDEQARPTSDNALAHDAIDVLQAEDIAASVQCETDTRRTRDAYSKPRCRGRRSAWKRDWKRLPTEASGLSIAAPWSCTYHPCGRSAADSWKRPKAVG